VRAVRQHQKSRSNQAAPEAINNSVQLALSISGRCRELCQRNDPPVPLVERRKESPFCWRQLMPPAILEDKREVFPIYVRISIHQIRGGDLGAARGAKARPQQRSSSASESREMAPLGEYQQCAPVPVDLRPVDPQARLCHELQLPIAIL
jgi:hypothetical protein